jgi:hypothetical protein
MDAGRDDHFALGGTEGQQALSFEPEPVHPIVSQLRFGARAYATARGQDYRTEGLEGVQADPQLAQRVGEHYLTAPANTHMARRAWDAFANDVEDQHRHITENLGIKMEVSDQDPYRSPHEALTDIEQNGRLKVLSTAATGGHPYLTDEQNDKNRFVHDIFGHLASGRGFSRHGEEAAYHSHRQLFSHAAIPAVAAEYRAQNSVFTQMNQGKEFPQQRVIAMPSWASRSRLGPPG